MWSTVNPWAVNDRLWHLLAGRTDGLGVLQLVEVPYEARRPPLTPVRPDSARSAIVRLMTYRLTGASVDLRGAVTLRYTVMGTQPQTGTLLFSTTFYSADGDQIQQLGFKLLNGQLIAAFSYEHTATSNLKQVNYPVNPNRTGGTWTFVLPPDALQARNGRWRADLDIDGQSGGSIDGTPSTTISAD